MKRAVAELRTLRVPFFVALSVAWHTRHNDGNPRWAVSRVSVPMFDRFARGVLVRCGDRSCERTWVA